MLAQKGQALLKHHRLNAGAIDSAGRRSCKGESGLASPALDKCRTSLSRIHCTFSNLNSHRPAIRLTHYVYKPTKLGLGQLL